MWPGFASRRWLCGSQVGFALGLSFFLPGSDAATDAASSGRTVFPDSIAQVDPVNSQPSAARERAVVVRAQLSSAEKAASMEIEVSLKMRDFAGLQARINRHELISRAEIAEKYLPLPADANRVAAWLASQGLTVTPVDAARLGVFARGSVSQMSAAFQVTFARVASDGAEFTSAITPPSLPTAVAAAALGVTGLQPHQRHHGRPRRSPSSAVKAAPTGRAAMPALTGSAVAPYSPAELAQAYNVPALTGAGQTIAIIDDQFPKTTDLTAFWTLYGTGETLANYTQIPVGSGPSSGTDATEASLDVEWASALAPGAKIRIYGVSSLSAMSVSAVCSQIYSDLNSNPGLHSLSMSFASVENTINFSSEQTEVQAFALLALANVSIFASTGDGGSNPSDQSSGWVNQYPSGSIETAYPASDLNVTGVGGTSLNLTTSGAVASESAWNGSGGGASTYTLRPSWQNGLGVPTGTRRLTPDVAALADPITGVTVIIGGQSETYGGTSLSAPLWAAFSALINQARAGNGLGPTGPLNPWLYPMAGSPCFWDITTGNNGAEAAGAGYDEVTGLGVPNLSVMIAVLGAASQPVSNPSIGVPIFATRPANVTVTTGTTAAITATVTGAGPLTYQWQRLPVGGTVWTNVSDAGAYSGSATATLHVSPAIAAMSGDQFQCVATNYQGQVTGPITTLVTAFPLNVATFAGNPAVAGSVDATGLSAEFDQPNGVAIDLLGNLYVADILNDTIRKITPQGVVTTFAGTPKIPGHADGVGEGAQFNEPDGIAIDSSGNLYVADFQNDTIRMVTPAGVVTTVAGVAGVAGYADGPAATATFSSPRAVEVDGVGNLYVSDTGNNTIRKISPAGTVSTLAGSPFAVGSVDGTGNAAQFNGPRGLRLDAAGNLLVADTFNDLIRKVTPAGVVTTVAGVAEAEGSADGTGSNARLGLPYGLVFDAFGNLYFTEEDGDTVRMMTPNGTVSTLAGLAFNPDYQDGAGEDARLSTPLGIAIDSANNLYIADSDYNIIRKAALVSTPQIVVAPASQTVPVGGYLVLSVEGGGGGLAYQWDLNGVPILGATGPTYTVSSVQTTNAGNYTVTLTNSVGSLTSGIAAVAVPSTNASPSRLGNLSTRANVGAGGSIIAGFIVAGTGSKQVLVRGIGPALANYGVVGTLAQPELELFNVGATIPFVTNAGWGTTPGGTGALSAAFAQTGAFPLATNSADSAVIATIPQAGSNGATAQIVGLNNTTGIALAEVYDLDSVAAPARLVNLSTRALAGSGANALIAGFVISGTNSETLLVRGIGPALTQFGVTGVLAVPTLTVFNRSGVPIASNTGWGGTAALSTVFAQTGAFAITNPNSADCALVITLPPGLYTAQVSGVNGSTGTALIELYEVP